MRYVTDQGPKSWAGLNPNTKAYRSYREAVINSILQRTACLSNAPQSSSAVTTLQTGQLPIIFFRNWVQGIFAKREFYLALSYGTIKVVPLQQIMLNLIEVLQKISNKGSAAKQLKGPPWNFKKANCCEYSVVLEKSMEWIPAVASTWERFAGAVIAALKNSIPRGFREEYIPGWIKK
nr:unnamed protein product [Callosobruchus chinensis]